MNELPFHVTMTPLGAITPIAGSDWLTSVCGSIRNRRNAVVDCDTASTMTSARRLPSDATPQEYARRPVWLTIVPKASIGVLLFANRFTVIVSSFRNTPGETWTGCAALTNRWNVV